MSRMALLLGFFLLAASLGVYMQATFWHNPVVELITLGDHVFRVPKQNSLENRGDSFGVGCCVSGLRPNRPAANFYMSAEEMAQIIEDYQVADGELEANIIWLVQFLDGQALERLQTPDKVTGDVWHQRGYMKHSIVSRYRETDFYRVQAKGYKTFWKLTRLPPQPGQPPPPKGEFLAADCSDGNNRRTETGRLTSCRSWLLHQNLFISFHIDGFNLHLVDKIGEALAGKLEEWRVQSVAGS